MHPSTLSFSRRNFVSCSSLALPTSSTPDYESAFVFQVMTIAMGRNDYETYYFFFVHYAVYGYLLIRARRELIIEKYVVEVNFQQWKHILDIMHDPIIIYSSTEVIYHNRALTSIIENYEVSTNDILTKVNYL